MAEAERTHGGLQARELDRLGLAPDSVLDMSVNVNPYGPCRAVMRAVASCALDRYPDPSCWPARRALAAALGVAPECVVLGNGASELLWTLARVLVPATAVIAEPAFGEMRAACEAHGVKVIGVRGARARAYAPDFDALGAAAERARAGFVYLCSPGSPIGTPVAFGELEAFAARLRGCHVVLDESFLSLSDRHADAALPLPHNIVRVRSLTKDHALPGARVGYALAPAEVVQRVERSRPSWTVSALAQAVAPVAVRQTAFVEQSRAWLARDREALVADLLRLGFAPLPSSAPYLAIPVADATTLRERLLANHGVLVRDCASFGLPCVIRVAVRPVSERERLLEALQREAGAC